MIGEVEVVDSGGGGGDSNFRCGLSWLYVSISLGKANATLASSCFLLPCIGCETDVTDSDGGGGDSNFRCGLSCWFVVILVGKVNATPPSSSAKPRMLGGEAIDSGEYSMFWDSSWRHVSMLLGGVKAKRWWSSVMFLAMIMFAWDSLEIGETTEGSLISHGTVHFKHFFGDLQPLIYIYIFAFCWGVFIIYCTSKDFCSHSTMSFVWKMSQPVSIPAASTNIRSHVTGTPHQVTSMEPATLIWYWAMHCIFDIAEHHHSLRWLWS